MSKIGGAVEGIHVPAERRIAFRPASLLGHNRVFREMRAQPGHDGLFGALVGLRHDVDFPLVADLDRAGRTPRAKCPPLRAPFQWPLQEMNSCVVSPLTKSCQNSRVK